MDAKDLRTEAALGKRGNEGNSKYPQPSVLQANRNKTYDIGSNSLASKVEAQAARPCAVIGPDRVVPPPAPVDACLKKASVEPWPGPDPTYRRPPDYPHKLPDYNHPSRNISPRQTFQENMQRFMLPPSYNSTKLKEDHNFPVDTNISPQRNKLSGSTEGKYCEVPYIVSQLASEQKNIRSVDISATNNNQTVPKSAPLGWLPPSANIRHAKPYSAEVYQYPEYQNCAGPRPVLMPRPHRTVHEESGHMYNEAYYNDASLRYKPYPAVKERYPQARYDYLGNYANPFHPPPPPFPSHKYDVQKQLPPHPYSGYSQVPLKYMDTRMTDPTMNSYQRPMNSHTNFNSAAYRNQIIHPQYGPLPGNCLQPNKFYPYPLDKSITANKPPYDPTTHKGFGEYESVRGKPYNMPETYYVNEMMRHHPIKPTQVMPPNYPTVGIQGLPLQPYYRKDNPTMMNYETNPHYRNIDPSINLSGSMLSRLPTQFSPNAIAISPSESNTSNDTTHTLGTSQEDCGYVSQSSSASIRSVESALNRLQGDIYRRYDYRYGSMVRSLPTKSNANSETSLESKNKKNIDLRQYLQMWNEGEDENGESNNKDITISSSSNTHEIINLNGNTNKEQLYVLGLVNVPSEELSKYEHIQKVSKLPENIKGYNSIELLNQFEEVIESSNLNNYSRKPPTSRSFQISSLKSSAMQSIDIPSRPLSPLDVEAQISQSVIHKEVGCNFEIKPCSPKMLNVEVATPIKNVLGERVIEKVNNPVPAPRPILSRVNDSVGDCQIIKHQDHRITFDDNKASSCKMISSQYTSSENLSSAKSNYSLQDLESNSGVGLASLPRLDNDIELTFPEVNQQFINANKVESVITQNTTQKDLPPLDIDQSEVFQEMELKNLSPVSEEFSKLSKYRKKRRNSGCIEAKGLSVQSIRTNSVIIKNPENVKCLEKSIDYIANNNAQDAQQDPINLTVYSDPRGNSNKPNYSDNGNTTDISKNLTTIDFSKNSSIEIDNKESFSDNNQNLAMDECSDEENINKKSIVVPESSKPKTNNKIDSVLRNLGITEIKADTNEDFHEEILLIDKFKKIDSNKSERITVFDCEGILNNKQSIIKEACDLEKQRIIKEACDLEESSLGDCKKQTEDPTCHQLFECHINDKFDFNEEKVVFTLGNVNKHETSSRKFAKEPTDQELSFSNVSTLDYGISKIEDGYSEVISRNKQMSEIQSVAECNQKSKTVSDKSFESNVGQTQNKESRTWTKVHKELFSPRIQNLIVFAEGNPENLVKKTNSDTVFTISMQQESAKIELQKPCIHISSNQFEVDCFGSHRNFDKSAEITQVECLDEISENKTKSVCLDVILISNQDMSPQTAENVKPVRNESSDSLKSDPVFNYDNEDSSITDLDTCNDQSDLASNFKEETNVPSPQSPKDISLDLDKTELQSTNTENSKESVTVDVQSPQSPKDISLDLDKTELLSTNTENSKESVTIELESSKTTTAIMNPITNKHVDLSTESSEKTLIDSSADEDSGPSSGTDILEDKCIGYDKIKTNIANNKNEIKEKESLSIQTDKCGPKNNSNNESVQECKKNILSNVENSLPMHCKSLVHLDKVNNEKHCIPENSHLSIECTSNTNNTILNENEYQNSVKELNYEDPLKPIESDQTKDKDCIGFLRENIAPLDLQDQDTDTKSFNYTNVCKDNFTLSEEKENSNDHVHCASELSESIDNNSKQTVGILKDLYLDVQPTDYQLAHLNCTKPKFLSTNNSFLKNKTLKRSFSDSAINLCNQENTFFLDKRKKIEETVTYKPHIITENYCNIVQNSRRNSISTIYKDQNVSFCILIDNNCILTEDCESDKYCYTEIPEHCLSCIESDGDNEIMEENTELFSFQSDFELNEETDDVGEHDLQETWVEDIACVETVVSDEVAEDIVVTESTSPKKVDMSDDDNDIFNINEHTDKVKYIYGDKMCTNDAHLVETLYRTPQMDVNKTLINRESQVVDECHQYYDEESLEKLLSESTNFQTDTGCSLSAPSPSSSPIANSDTALSEKPDLDMNEDSISLLKNNTDLTKSKRIEHASLKTQDDSVYSCETSVDDVIFFDNVKEIPKRTTSSSPEVSSTTPEERNSSIFLKITNLGGARVAQVDSFDANKSVTNVSCKYTEGKDYAKSHNSLLPNRPLITKAAQKYIPPLKDTICDLKIKLPLPQHSLLKLKELKMSKEEPKLTNSIYKQKSSYCIRKEIPKKTKPRFEDVLKSIDDIQFKKHKEKSKKNKKLIPKVVIKKNENGSHYTSTSNKEKYNPDLTGRKWQPWVFIEKNNLIDKMAIKKKTKAVFSHRKNTFILADTFKKYRSITNGKFIISQPTSESAAGQLKYTIRLKHNY